MGLAELDVLAETVLSSPVRCRKGSRDEEDEVRQEGFLKIALARPWDREPDKWYSPGRPAYVAQAVTWEGQRAAAGRRRFEALRGQLGREIGDREGSESPEEAAIRAEDIRVVSEALADLPDRQRECLRLWADEGLSYDDIAHRLGVPSNTVASDVRRAREKLRGRLTRWRRFR